MEVVQDLWNEIKPESTEEWYHFVGLGFGPFVLSFLSALLSPATAYRNGRLKRPSYSPPSWIFGPMWTLLFLMMGFAAYLVYKVGGGCNEKTELPLYLFGIQYLINFIWSPIFFRYGNLSLALWTIGVLWFAIIATIMTFYQISHLAAGLLLPYLAWVSFASILNAGILRLNGAYFDMQNNNNGGGGEKKRR